MHEHNHLVIQNHTPLKVEDVLHMPLHDIKADNVRTSSTYVQIFERDRNRVRNDVREQTFDEMRPFSLRL